MKRLTLGLWSTTALIGLAATPAMAQDQTATMPNPGTTAQQLPSDPAQPADAPASTQTAAGTPANAGDAIVVTGLRRSLQSARNIKRNSTQIVDAVVAEDIGKLPDITVSDTAARIPGIQVERHGGEADRVLLRGLDRTYYTTTYNGREIFTAETRSVALQDFPAGAIQAIEAFKTSTANLVEPGIAGLLNVRSRRPFDFKGFEVNGSVWANYPNQSRDLKPNAQLMLTDRWNVGSGELGALINFSYTRMHYRDSVRRHGFFIADLAGFRSPDWPSISYGEGDRWRPSVNGALQWRSGKVELYAEGLWQGYRENISDRLFEQPLWNCGQATYSNLDVANGQILSGSVHSPGCVGTARGFQGATKRRTNTYQFAVGGSYDGGPLRITADLARTNSKFKLYTESVDFYLNNNNYTVNWYTGRPGGSGPTFEVTGFDFTNPANYNYRGFYEERLTAKGDDWQGRVDAEYQPAGLDWLPKVQFGARYVDRNATRDAGGRYWDANNTGLFQIPISTVPLDYRLFQSGFRGDNNRPTPTTWLSPTFNSVWNNLEALRQFNIDRGLPIDQDPNRAHNNDTNAPDMVPSRAFDINEKTLAGYGQLNFKFGGAVYVDGTLGMRVVRSRDRINGFRTLLAPGNPVTAINLKNSYTKWLPNLNLNVHLDPQVQLRLAATKTITRPLFEQLNPALNLNPPSPCDPAHPEDCAITGSGGNPYLKPLQSKNYDASLEYYFSKTGFASIAAFRRDMRGFIVNQTFQYPNPDPITGLPIRVTGPVNTNKGRIRGFEAQVTTFFDWDWVPTWARSFGAQANVTYIDPKVDLTVIGAQRRVPIQDVSKWTWNLVGMYESGPFTARLSYNRRSSYPEGPIDQRGDFTLQGRGNPVSRLDLSTNYNVTDNVTLFFDWLNILKKPFKSDIVRVNYAGVNPTTTEIFPMVVRYEESVISGGVRFHFGHVNAPPVVAAPMMPPPPPAPVVEQAPPPPPPAPVQNGQRG